MKDQNSKEIPDRKLEKRPSFEDQVRVVIKPTKERYKTVKKDGRTIVEKK